MSWSNLCCDELLVDLLSAGAGTVPILMELLSTETGTPGSPRTLQTKGRMWGEGTVEWNTDLAAEAEGALHSLEASFWPALQVDTHPFPSHHYFSQVDRHHWETLSSIPFKPTAEAFCSHQWLAA